MRTRRLAAAAAVATGLAVLSAQGCGGGTAPTAPSALQPQPVLPLPAPLPIVPDAVVAAAGDVGMCGRAEAAATARLLDDHPGTILALGDLAYPAGSDRDFANCYDPHWGRHRSRTRPAPGNHDYQTAAGAFYYAYFGEHAGPAGRGYYSYREGAWLLISLNSNVPAGPDSAQAAWLRQTLAEDQAPCTLAYWHHPVFSSGPNGNSSEMRHLWSVLQAAGAEVVLAAHDHLYERFAPQDADGRSDRKGLRQFTVGTGGAYLYEVKTVRPNSELRLTAHGVLKLTLKADGYDWQFIGVPGSPGSDFGSDACH
jgi:hypothetical protein